MATVSPGLGTQGVHPLCGRGSEPRAGSRATQQGARGFHGQADPETPGSVPLPWPRAPGVSNCSQPSLV